MREVPGYGYCGETAVRGGSWIEARKFRWKTSRMNRYQGDRPTRKIVEAVVVIVVVEETEDER